MCGGILDVLDRDIYTSLHARCVRFSASQLSRLMHLTPVFIPGYQVHRLPHERTHATKTQIVYLRGMKREE